jgi:hypothetical protein
MHEGYNSLLEAYSESGVGSSSDPRDGHMPTMRELDTLLLRNEQFERLVSGQESEIGEAPPAYRNYSEPTQAIVG